MTNNELLNKLSNYKSDTQIFIRTYNMFGMEIVVPIEEFELDNNDLCLIPQGFDNLE